MGTSNGNTFTPVPFSKQKFLLSITVNRSLQIENNSFRQKLYDTLLKLNRLEILFEMKPKNLESYLMKFDPDQDKWKKKNKKLVKFYEKTKQDFQKLLYLSRLSTTKFP